MWKRAVDLAKEEEASGGGSESYYKKLSLDELIAVGERLRATKSKEEQCSVLTEKCPTGEYWYDIILGHVNDKAFYPVKMRLEQLAKLSMDKRLKAGLDVGSGLGNTLRSIAPYFEKVVGVEKLPPLAELAKNDPSMPENAEIISADATKIPFADETFNITVSNGMTHYLKKNEIKQYIREVSRTLKNGGMYFEAFTVKNPNDLLPNTEVEYLTSAKALLVCLLDNVVSKVDDEGEDSSLSFPEIVEAFKENGVYLSEPHDIDESEGSIAVGFVKGKKL